MSGSGNQKKRHHYVPVTYLNQFVDERKRIFAYRKDSPFDPIHVAPGEIAFERYYYSQPLPTGGRDNNSLENLFSKTEDYWQALVNLIKNKQDIGDLAPELFNFVSLLRVRVPAARDPAELLYVHMIRRSMHRMIDIGEISAPPQNLTLQDINISLDPHQSISAMSSMLKGLSCIWENVGIEFVHNMTHEPYITSDNPVIYFDPDVPEDRMLPYTVRPPERRVELLMPISPTLMLRGRTEIPILKKGDRLRHVDMKSRAEVCRVNHLAIRFGYRFIISNHARLKTLVSKYAALSPTVRFDSISGNSDVEYNISQMIFGKRPRKPKWKKEY